MCFLKKKHVPKLMALKIHAIINTCYKLLINDSTEKKRTPVLLTITLLKVENESKCFKYLKIHIYVMSLKCISM